MGALNNISTLIKSPDTWGYFGAESDQFDIYKALANDDKQAVIDAALTFANDLLGIYAGIVESTKVADVSLAGSISLYIYNAEKWGNDYTSIPAFADVLSSYGAVISAVGVRSDQPEFVVAGTWISSYALVLHKAYEFGDSHNFDSFWDAILPYSPSSGNFDSDSTQTPSANALGTTMHTTSDGKIDKMQIASIDPESGTKSVHVYEYDPDTFVTVKDTLTETNGNSRVVTETAQNGDTVTWYGDASGKIDHTESKYTDPSSGAVIKQNYQYGEDGTTLIGQTTTKTLGNSRIVTEVGQNGDTVTSYEDASGKVDHVETNTTDNSTGTHIQEVYQYGSDGSTLASNTKTVTQQDGSSVRTITESDGSQGIFTRDTSGAIIKSELITTDDNGVKTDHAVEYNPDGTSSSTTDAVTAADNSKTTTIVNQDGTASIVKQNSDGTVTQRETVKTSDNGVTTDKIDQLGPDGKTIVLTTSSVRQPDGSSVSTTGDASGRNTTAVIKDANGNIQQVHTTTTDGTGAQTDQYVAVDPNTHLPTAQYTVINRLDHSSTSTVTLPDGTKTVTERDGKDNITSEFYALPNGSVIKKSYGGDGSESDIVKNADGSGSTTLYNPDHSVKNQTLRMSDGSTTTKSYDGSGKLVYDNANYADGTSSTIIYNDDGSSTVHLVNGDGEDIDWEIPAPGSEAYTAIYVSDEHFTNQDGSVVYTGYLTVDHIGSRRILFTDGASVVTLYDQNGYASLIVKTNADGSGNETAIGGDFSTGYSIDFPAGTSPYYNPTLYQNSGESSSSLDLSNWFASARSISFPNGDSIITSYFEDGRLASETLRVGGKTTTNTYFENAVLKSSKITAADGTFTDTTYYPNGNKATLVSNTITTNALGVSVATAITENFYGTGIASTLQSISSDGISNYVTYYSNGAVSSQKTTAADGSYTLTTQPPNAPGQFEQHHADGTYTIQISGITSYYTATGFKYKDMASTNGTVNYYAPDGSSSGTTNFFSPTPNISVYNKVSQQSYGLTPEFTTNYTNDGDGNSVTTTFQTVNGTYHSTLIKTNDSWTKSDGSHGTNIYAYDGSVTSTNYSSNGNIYTYFDDGLGISTYQYTFSLANTIELPKPASGRDSTVFFESGLSVNNISVSATIGLDGQPALLINMGNGHSLTIDDGFDSSIQHFRFTDGSSLSLDQLLKQAVNIPATVHTSNGDFIFVGKGQNTIVDASGNDTIYGGSGNDTYVFSNDHGIDTVVDFDRTAGNLDVIKFTNFKSTDVTGITRIGDDLVINDGLQNQVTIKNQFSSTGISIEQFEFSDGVAWTSTELITHHLTQLGTSGNDNLTGWSDFNNSINGADGNDTLTAFNGDDTLIGGTGFDYLGGDTGNDTYIVNAAGSADLYDQGGDSDVVIFDGIKSTDITKISRVGTSLTFSYGTVNSLSVEDYFTGTNNQIEKFEFSDGVIWTKSDLMSLPITQDLRRYYQSGYVNGWDGTDVIYAIDSFDNSYNGSHIYANGGDDTIYGGGGNDFIDGGDGNDLILGGGQSDYLSGGNGDDTLIGGMGDDQLQGGAGNDTYIFSKGDGNDFVVEASGADPNKLDVIQFLDVKSTDVQLSGSIYSANNLVIKYGATDSITIYGAGSDPSYQIDQFRFSDGVVWTNADILAYTNTQTLTVGQGVAVGWYGKDVIKGSAGNDTLNGLGGNDTLYGRDGNDILYGGNGNDLLFGQNGSDFLDGGSGDDTIVGNGSINADGGSDTLSGGAGNDTLEDVGGNDTMIGGVGDDYFIGSYDDNGNPGHYTYVFSQGDGNDTINASGSINTLQFLDVASDQLRGVRYDNGDLIIDYGLNDSITLKYFFYVSISLGEDYRKIQFSDKTLTISQVLTLYPTITTTYLSDGSYIISNNDNQGNVTSITYDENGTELRSTYSFENGNNGYKNFGSDGSIYENDHLADGSYTDYNRDGQGNSSTYIYGVNGQLISSISNYADGSSTGTSFSVDRSYVNYSNDGHGNSASYSYSADNIEISEQFTNADGTSSGTSHNPDGSYSSYSNDGYGHIITSYFDTTGNYLGYSVTANDNNGNFVTTNYDVSGIKLSDSYANSDGSHGTDIFNIDGVAISGRLYHSDSSYETYSTDSQSIVTKTYFDLTGSELGYSIISKSQGVVSTINYDVNGNQLNSKIVSSDGFGNTTTINYDANGLKLSDSYIHADGSYGNDTFNADGIAINSVSYQADGSYAIKIIDSDGTVTTTQYTASGMKLGYSITSNFGLGSFTATNYDASGIELGHSVISNDGQGNSTSYNYDMNGYSLGYSYTYANGAHGFYTFIPDGFASGTNYQPDGSYSSYVQTDYNGSTITKNFDSSGHETGHSSKTNYNSDDGYAHSDSLYYAPDGTLIQTGSFAYDGLGDFVAINNFPLTGEVSGSSRNIGDGYTYAFDNLQLGNGVVEMRSTNYYDDGTSTSTDTILGTSTDDVITASYSGTGVLLQGLAGNDTLTGNYGNDTLEGGTGNDYLEGGLGSDTYVFNLGDGQDSVDNASVYAQSGTIDTLMFGAGITVSDIQLKVIGNDLLLSIQGTNDQVTLLNWNADQPVRIDQVQFADGTVWDQATLEAYAFANLNHAPTLVGTVDSQQARDGNLYSFTIPATLFNDEDQGDVLSYSFALADGSPLPGWLSFDAQTRTLSGTPSSSNIGNLLNLSLTATDNSGASVSTSFQLPVLAMVGKNLVGTTANNQLIGGSGNDTIDGGTGADTLMGGLGDDTYVVDNIGDVVIENADEGVDTINSSISYTLSANLENLTLLNTGNITGTGNALDNVLTGNAGNNILDGGLGADTLIGGAGKDTYLVDDVNDVVIETSTDTAETDLVKASISYTLGANLENLTLTGTDAINGMGNDLANILTGNAANNILDGGFGADKMSGGAGDDTYMVDNTGDVIVESANSGTDNVQSSVSYSLSSNVENLTLTGMDAINGTGNNLANTLIGNSTNNLLSGGTGADTLIGGLGDDTYVVDNMGDVVTENVGEGVDTINSSISYTLSANLENLTLLNKGNITGTGNALDNVLTGNAGANQLIGGAGNDTLTGGKENDTLTGGTGNDTYQFTLGDGIDTIIEKDVTAGNIDVLKFTSGTSYDQLWFRHVANNLEISIIGTTDKTIIKDWYTGTVNHVEQISTVDGSHTLLDTQVQNLVNAMASLTPLTAGQTTLPPAYQTQLAPVLAANWS